MQIEKVFYVNLYLIDQAYGGPEEGGWYYTYGEFEHPAALFTEEDEAYEFARKLNDEAYGPGGINEGRPSISSVNSRGQYHYQVEDKPGRDFPEYTPHYE